MTYDTLNRNIAYLLIIPFMLITVALNTVITSAIIEKIFMIIFVIVILFAISKKFSNDLFLISFGFFSSFLFLGLIHYLKYYELSHILLPILFFISFYLGVLFPYKNNFLYIVFATVVSFYLSYNYVNSFQIEMKYGRFYAEHFDINYLGFIFNFLFLIAVFYLKEYRKNIMIYIALLVILIAGLATSSRGTLIAFSFGLALLLYNENIKTRLFTIVSFLVLLAVFISFNIEMVDAFVERFNNPAHRDELVSYAFDFYLKSDIFLQLFGTWGGAFKSHVGLVTHNDILRILIDFGILNLILYILMYMAIIVNIFIYINKNHINATNKIYAYFILMMILMYLFRGMFSNFFPAFFIFYFIGSFYGMKNINRSNNLKLIRKHDND